MVQPTVRARRPRGRKIGIVAVARRLVIDLWRYLDAGVIPEACRPAALPSPFSTNDPVTGELPGSKADELWHEELQPQEMLVCVFCRKGRAVRLASTSW